MSAKIIDGKAIAAEIKEGLKERVAALKEQGKNLKVTYNGEYCEGDKIRVDITEGEFVAVKLDEKLAGLLWPAGGWGTPFLALSVVGNTLVITHEWNSALVADDSLEILESLISGHALNGVANLEHWLEVNALLNSLSLEAFDILLETVGLAHDEKVDQTVKTDFLQ